MNDLYHDDDFDGMSGRALEARWVLSASLVLETAAHFGGQEGTAVDMPILRCGRSGRPLLMGTSLAGALRAHVLDRLAGYGCDDKHSDVARIFGGTRGDDSGAQSPLIVFDALGTAANIEIRDGVSIDPRTGTAADRKKFDFEVIPAGTTFPLRFDLLVPNRGADESRLLSTLCLALEGFSNGEIRLGMRRRRGLGEIVCSDWKARRFDLSSSNGWLEWIGSDHEQPFSDVIPGQSSAIRAIRQAGWPLSAVTNDERKRLLVEAEAVILGELLVRSPAISPADPDVSHLQSNGHAVLPGATIAGVMRAHALRIVQLVHGLDRHIAEERWIAPLFGRNAETVSVPEGARLWVSECRIKGGVRRTVTRVAIDRFTQGVVPHALFDEAPHAGGEVKLRFEVRDPRPGQAGLLLLVLKDLLSGSLPVGGSSSVGRGVLAGRCLKVWGSGVPMIECLFDKDAAAGGSVPVSDELDRLVQDFVAAAARHTQPNLGEAPS